MNRFRIAAALGLAGLIMFAIPASAHLKTYADGENDAYQGGDTGTTAHVSPLDLSGFSFKEKASKYKITLSLHSPLDVSTLWCSPSACKDSTLEGRGVLDSVFYRVVDGEEKNSYLVEVQNNGSDGLIAYLFKAGQDASIDFATATLSDDGMTVSLGVPRAKIKGQTEGRKIYIDGQSNFWMAAGTGYCEFDANAPHGNACVDWIRTRTT